MSGGELDLIGRSDADLPGPHLAGIGAEMADIFTRAGATDSPVHRPRPATVSALRLDRTGRSAVTLLAAAAAGVVGLAAGAFIIRTPSAPPAPAPTPVVQAAAPAPSPEPTVRAPLVAADAGPPTLTRAVPGAATDKPAPAATAETRRSRIAVAKASARHPALAMAQPASCEHDAAGPGCRRAVIQADRHLRDIYANAIRRGVPRAVLVDYRDRWVDLRDTETDDPRRLIQSYGALAYELGREARDDEEGAQRRRNPSGLKALADVLLPWR
jgi:hypothetical protein